MAESWLAPGEQIVGSWSVYIGDPSPNSAKITGKLHVSGLNVHFDAGLSLQENAAAMISRLRPIQPFRKLDNHITIPFSDIAGVKNVKKSFLLKALILTLRSGEEIEFQFGAASPQKAADAIAAKI